MAYQKPDYRQPELALAFVGSPPSTRLTVGLRDLSPVAGDGLSPWAGRLEVRLCVVHRGYADAPNLHVEWSLDRPFLMETTLETTLETPRQGVRGRARIAELARTPYGQLAHVTAASLAPGRPEALPAFGLYVPLAAFRAPYELPLDYAVMSEVHPRRTGTLLLAFGAEPEPIDVC